MSILRHVKDRVVWLHVEHVRLVIELSASQLEPLCNLGNFSYQLPVELLEHLWCLHFNAN